MPRLTIIAPSISLLIVSACNPTAPITVSVSLGSIDLDSEVSAFEDAACFDTTEASCAVLSAIADVPWSPDEGPSQRPSLPSVFAPTVDLPSLNQRADIQRWFADTSLQRFEDAVGPCSIDVDPAEAAAGCSLGRRRRMDLVDLNTGIGSPELMADAHITRAVLVRDQNDSLQLPPFEIFVSDEERGSALLARSAPFDVGGVAVLDTGADALAMLADAIATEVGYVEMGRVADEAPALVPNDEGKLRRPEGTMNLSLVLHLEVPLTSVATALQEQ